jgi:arylsulfatase A-like enzyme
MRVPFIAAWAKPAAANPHQQALPIAANAVQPHLASVIDLFPTVLDVTQGKAPDSHQPDGQSLRVLLGGKNDPAHSDAFLMHYPHAPHRSDYWTSLRQGEWKVIYHYLPGAKGKHYQLFHLKNDPYEQQDLAEKDPATLERMMKLLIASLERHKAQYPHDKEGKELRPKLPPSQ